MAKTPSYRAARAGPQGPGNAPPFKKIPGSRFPRFAPFTLGVRADGEGIRIYRGALLYSITTLNFQRVFLKEDPPINSLAGQDPIPGVSLKFPNIFEESSSSSGSEDSNSKWRDLGWWGDVYLCWEADPLTCHVTSCSIEGPDQPEGVPIAALDESLSRESSSSGSGTRVKYFLKIGSVSETAEVTQDFNSDLHWHPTFVPANPGSDSSSSSQSAPSSESSSSSSDSDSDSDSDSSSSDSSSDDSQDSEDPSSESTDPTSSSSDSDSSHEPPSSGGGSSGGGGGGSSSDGSSGGGGGDSSGGGSSGGGGGDDSGSDKSSAIVPLDLSPTKYAALLTMESPEVLFYDVQQAPVKGFKTQFDIDPWFIAVCEPGSLKVVGATCDRPALVGAKITNRSKAVFEIVSLPFMRPSTVHFQIIGTRRGFKGMRFPLRDREQFLANEKHLNSAYPAKDFGHLKSRDSRSPQQNRREK